MKGNKYILEEDIKNVCGKDTVFTEDEFGSFTNTDEKTGTQITLTDKFVRRNKIKLRRIK